MPPAATSPAAILVDWGTTNARAWAVAADGEIVRRRETGAGIRNVGDGDFAAAFDRLAGDWLAEARAAGAEPPVVMSGMIGSRQGWSEAPYAACPAGPDEIAALLHPVPGRSGIRIVPGVHLVDGDRHDVMRGEEVQCFGALQRAEIADGLVCLPGTHSKWVRMEAGRIVRFASAMTGETYAAMRDHSILGALMTRRGENAGAAERGGADDAGRSGALARGVARSGEPGGLLNHLFSVRADGLFGAVAGDHLADYLSGILIGHEIRAMEQMFPTQGPVLVVGGGALSHIYGAALGHLGLPFRTVDGERATVDGLRAILARD